MLPVPITEMRRQPSSPLGVHHDYSTSQLLEQPYRGWNAHEGHDDVDGVIRGSQIPRCHRHPRGRGRAQRLLHVAELNTDGRRGFPVRSIRITARIL